MNYCLKSDGASRTFSPLDIEISRQRQGTQSVGYSCVQPSIHKVNERHLLETRQTGRNPNSVHTLDFDTHTVWRHTEESTRRSGSS